MHGEELGTSVRHHLLELGAGDELEAAEKRGAHVTRSGKINLSGGRREADLLARL